MTVRFETAEPVFHVAAPRFANGLWAGRWWIDGRKKKQSLFEYFDDAASSITDTFCSAA